MHRDAHCLIIHLMPIHLPSPLKSYSNATTYALHFQRLHDATLPERACHRPISGLQFLQEGHAFPEAARLKELVDISPRSFDVDISFFLYFTRCRISSSFIARRLGLDWALLIGSHLSIFREYAVQKLSFINISFSEDGEYGMHVNSLSATPRQKHDILPAD